MSKDITSLLTNWDYDPTKVSARWVKGQDGLMKIQLRLDLGLFQMEADGRPDARKPRGYSTLLDYYLTLERTSRGTPFPRLGEDACSELQQEAVQFYYRYLALHALRHYEGVIRDTRHNMAILELVERHAEDEDLAWEFVQYYPYIRMMNARALAEQFTDGGRNEYEMAILCVDEAIKDVRKFWKKYDDTEYDEDITTEEEEVLGELLEDLRKRKPKSEAEKLREDLERAIVLENYELAASLRDTLHKIEKKERRPQAKNIVS